MPGGGSQKCTGKRLLDAGRAGCACLWANDFTSVREALPSMRPRPRQSCQSTPSLQQPRAGGCAEFAAQLWKEKCQTPECSEQKFRTQVQPDTALTCLHVGSCDISKRPHAVICGQRTETLCKIHRATGTMVNLYRLAGNRVQLRTAQKFHRSQVLGTCLHVGSCEHIEETSTTMTQI